MRKYNKKNRLFNNTTEGLIYDSSSDIINKAYKRIISIINITNDFAKETLLEVYDIPSSILEEIIKKSYFKASDILNEKEGLPFSIGMTIAIKESLNNIPIKDEDKLYDYFDKIINYYNYAHDKIVNTYRLLYTDIYYVDEAIENGFKKLKKDSIQHKNAEFNDLILDTFDDSITDVIFDLTKINIDDSEILIRYPIAMEYIKNNLDIEENEKLQREVVKLILKKRNRKKKEKHVGTNKKISKKEIDENINAIRLFGNKKKRDERNEKIRR